MYLLLSGFSCCCSCTLKHVKHDTLSKRTICVSLYQAVSYFAGVLVHRIPFTGVQTLKDEVYFVKCQVFHVYDYVIPVMLLMGSFHVDWVEVRSSNRILQFKLMIPQFLAPYSQESGCHPRQHFIF